MSAAVSSSPTESSSYENLTLCIDGGGSKTVLQIIDGDGRVLSLFKDSVASDEIRAGASNINSIGAAGVKSTLAALFKEVRVGSEEIELCKLIGKCQVVAGMAGVGLSQNREAVTALFEEWGVRRELLHLMTDADLGLQLVNGHGAILISGTGSICLGTKGGLAFRVGGLGPVLGDEGSGYQVGLQAVKAVLAEEYGWGEQTTLTAALREYFAVPELKSLIREINLREMPAAKIAGLAPIVFAHAKEMDRAALAIVQKTSEEIKQLLATMLKVSGLANCQIHLWGGLFKSQFAGAFIEKLEEELSLHARNIQIVNQSLENPALLFARLLQKERAYQASLSPQVLPYKAFVKDTSAHESIALSIRLVKENWKRSLLDDRELYYLIANVEAQVKKNKEQGIHSPPVFKIILTMLHFNKTTEQFQEAVEFLLETNERIDWISPVKVE